MGLAYWDDVFWPADGPGDVAGIAVAVLGILGLTTGAAGAMLLTLAAAIVAGAAMLLASTVLSGRFVRTVVPHTA
jgi:hypothetical protein